MKADTKRARREAELVETVDHLDWYAFRTEPQKEFVAQMILKRRGMTSWVPVEFKWRHRNKYQKAQGKPKVRMTYPLLRGWLFIGFRPGIPPFYDVFRLRCITRVVCDGAGCPIAMKRPEMRRFLSRHVDGLQRPREERFMRTHGEFAVGDLVRVIDGPFQDHVFTADRIDDGQALYRHKLLGKLIEVPIALNNLEAA